VENARTSIRVGLDVFSCAIFEPPQGIDDRKREIVTTKKVVRTKRTATTTTASKAELTRRRILTIALDLFRREGFDQATMRRIAEEAGVSLGLAYRYFPSKEAIALAFYREHVESHVAAAERAFDGVDSLRERIRIALKIGLDVRGADRALLAVMARTALDPSLPIGLFAKETKELRERSKDMFRKVCEVPQIPDDVREVAALALWALHLALLLRFVHDESPAQEQTQKLLEGAAELASQIAPLIGLPLIEPFRRRLIEVLEAGGILPSR
jgi:AcrR family transcriptional regulator